MTPRRLLKDDAVPTLFTHNKDKQPQKCKSSELREEASAKRQLREDAVENHKLFQRFDFKCNTKGIKTVGEIMPLKVDIGVQCNIEFTQHEEHYEPALSSESETEANKEDNDDLYFENNKEDNSQDIAVSPSKPAFIVYWTSLLVLLKHCLFPVCVATTIITDIAYKGFQLIVKMKCPEGHTTAWKSQPNFNHYSVGNLTSAASVLFSANTYKRLAIFFDLAGIQLLSKPVIMPFKRSISWAWSIRTIMKCRKKLQKT